MTPLLSLLVGIAVIAVITAFTGYFVAQEFAFMAVDRSHVNAAAANGDAEAARILTVTRRTSFMLSGAQLGITITGLLVGYVAEPLVGDAVGELLGGVNVPTGVGIVIGAVLALAVSTVVQMVFGELFPKNLAIARPEPVARKLAGSTIIYLRLAGWLVHIFDAASNLLLRALRIEPVHDVEHSATARDLEHIVADSRDSGDLPVELSVLLDRILDFPTRTVEHAMIPRTRVDVVPADSDVASVRRLMSTGHSRYPVIDEDDQIVGAVHLADVLDARTSSPVVKVMRPVPVLPTLMRLPDALAQLTASKNQLACVVDEYGGFAGVLTLEDLAEEIVGEITDEHDHVAAQVVSAAGEDAWLAPGAVHVDEVERAIGRDLPRGDYETLSGLVIAQIGALPQIGSVIDIRLPDDPADLVLDEPPERRLAAEVLAIENHVPSMLRLTLHTVQVPTESASGDDH